MPNRQNTDDETSSPDQPDTNTFHIRLPGFIPDTPIGLGDVVKRTTSYMGIKPCGGCDRRAAALNRWMVFSGKR